MLPGWHHVQQRCLPPRLSPRYSVLLARLQPYVDRVGASRTLVWVLTVSLEQVGLEASTVLHRPYSSVLFPPITLVPCVSLSSLGSEVAGLSGLALSRPAAPCHARSSPCKLGSAATKVSGYVAKMRVGLCRRGCFKDMDHETLLSADFEFFDGKFKPTAVLLL